MPACAAMPLSAEAGNSPQDVFAEQEAKPQADGTYADILQTDVHSQTDKSPSRAEQHRHVQVIDGVRSRGELRQESVGAVKAFPEHAQKEKQGSTGEG